MAFSPQRALSRTPPDRGGLRLGWGSVMAAAKRDRKPVSEESGDSDDSDSYFQDNKGPMSKQGDGGIGVKLEDEMNNDHLQKLQEIFEVKFNQKIKYIFTM